MHDLETIIELNNGHRFSLPRPFTGIAVKDGEPFIVRCEVDGWIQDAKAQLAPLAIAAGGQLIAALPGYHQDRILATWQPDFN